MAGQGSPPPPPPRDTQVFYVEYETIIPVNLSS